MVRGSERPAQQEIQSYNIHWGYNENYNTPMQIFSTENTNNNQKTIPYTNITNTLTTSNIHIKPVASLLSTISTNDQEKNTNTTNKHNIQGETKSELDCNLLNYKENEQLTTHTNLILREKIANSS